MTSLLLVSNDADKTESVGVIGGVGGEKAERGLGGRVKNNRRSSFSLSLSKCMWGVEVSEFTLIGGGGGSYD